MASIVIVTKQCYLICESINYIIVNEIYEDDAESDLSMFSLREKPRKKRKTRRPTKKELDLIESKQYNVVIDFVPINGINPNNGNKSLIGNNHSVAIRVTGRSNCLELFSHMVEQIREQIPDHMFLDRMVEKFLAESAIAEPQK